MVPAGIGTDVPGRGGTASAAAMVKSTGKVASIPSPTSERRHLRVAVGVHDGGISGVNTYAEHVAAAAATVVDDVTLLATHAALAEELRARLGPTGVGVIDLGLDPVTPWQRRRERISPAYAAHRLAAAVASARARLGARYDVAHLNHPPLAAAVRPITEQVVVAGWFHPHSSLGRAVATWEHTGRRFPRSAGLAIKGVLHHRNDVRGYRNSDRVVVPTRRLTEELRRARIDAVQCFPPCRLVGEGPAGADDGDREHLPRLMICGGDLGHPRKNVATALDAVRLMASGGRAVRLELVGGNAEALHDRLDRLPASVAVTITGRLPAREVHARMRRADVFLLPSLFEEWGYVAVEAALHGTPVVTLPVYPFDEMLDGRLGRCARDTSVAGYAEAISGVLDNPTARDEVARVAEERFGLRSIGPRLLEIWSTG